VTIQGFSPTTGINGKVGDSGSRLRAPGGWRRAVPMTTVDVGGNTVFAGRCGNAAVYLTTLNRSSAWLLPRANRNFAVKKGYPLRYLFCSILTNVLGGSGTGLTF